MLVNVILVASGILAGGIVALKVIAPLTKTKVDDSILSKLETLEDLLVKLKDKV